MRFITAAFASALICATPTMAIAQDSAETPVIEEISLGGEFPGAFFQVPEGVGPFPTIILLGGSEGGDSGARGMAPRFLAEGYAVLGLPYYSPAPEGDDRHIAGLPQAFAEIPVDGAVAARDWLMTREEVDAGAIGIYGVSKGAEFALLAGSLSHGFAAIAAIVPSDVVWEGWGAGRTVSSFSWQGQPLPFVPYLGMREEFANPTGPDGRPRIRLPHDRGRHANPDRAVIARILVENIDAPVLVAGGDADLVWNSGEMAQAIAERRAAAGLTTVSLVYTDAGHFLSGDGNDPNSSDANREAQLEIWPATLAFFADHLRGE